MPDGLVHELVEIDLKEFVEVDLNVFAFVDLCCLSHVVEVVVREFVLETASEIVFAVVNFGFDYFGECCAVAVTQDIL